MPGTICWWPINTEQAVVLAARGTEKSSASPILSDVPIDSGVDKPQRYSKNGLHLLISHVAHNVLKTTIALE